MKIAAIGLRFTACVYLAVFLFMATGSVCLAQSNLIVAINTGDDNDDDFLKQMNSDNTEVRPEVEGLLNTDEQYPSSDDELPGLEDPTNLENEVDPDLELDPSLEPPMEDEEYPDLPGIEDEYNDEDIPYNDEDTPYNEDIEQQIEDTLNSDSYDS